MRASAVWIQESMREWMEIASMGKAQAAVRARLGVTSHKTLARQFEVANQGNARRTTGPWGWRETRRNGSPRSRVFSWDSSMESSEIFKLALARHSARVSMNRASHTRASNLSRVSASSRRVVRLVRSSTHGFIIRTPAVRLSLHPKVFLAAAYFFPQSAYLVRRSIEKLEKLRALRSQRHPEAHAGLLESSEFGAKRSTLVQRHESGVAGCRLATQVAAFNATVPAVIFQLDDGVESRAESRPLLTRRRQG
ncbi:hypothetical protein C8J57DRAFT_1246788 [Mycena rebaudengoi]|nr:hypothetical protein C8J57DRAFT_1246788 [Mycena rebaudengoi]